MGYVLASVVCSVLVSVLLKLAPRLCIEVGQAVAWNYVVAAAAAMWLLDASFASLARGAVPWWTLAALGVLLPSIFLVLAASIRHAGIVRSDAAQRLSLVLSLAAAFLLFGEAATAWKLVGCALGLVALIGMVWRNAGPAGDGGYAWLWPLAVFGGFGAIDILLKRVAATGLPLATQLAVMFSLALVVAFAIEIVRRSRFTWRSCAGGLVLGVLNFGNIFFYLRAHRALPHHPSLVFAGMNLGVVALGSVVGLVLFHERLGRLNLAAVALALVAVAVLARA